MNKRFFTILCLPAFSFQLLLNSCDDSITDDDQTSGDDDLYSGTFNVTSSTISISYGCFWRNPLRVLIPPHMTLVQAAEQVFIITIGRLLLESV